MENQPLAERLRPKNLDEYIGQQHFNNLIELAKEYFGVQPSGVESLPKSGSQRRYYRLFVNGKSFIGVYNDNLNENQLFINFTLHFGAKKLHVPQIFAISKDGLSYIQEDLGRSMLLDFALNKDNTGGLTEEVMHLYRQALVKDAKTDELIEDLIDCARLAPSAKNRQPWKFLIVKNDIKNQ